MNICRLLTACLFVGVYTQKRKMSYRHQSGAEKRKKKKVQEQAREKLTKITTFFTDRENEGQEAGASCSFPLEVNENTPATRSGTNAHENTDRHRQDDLILENDSRSDVVTGETVITKDDKISVISKWPDFKTDHFIRTVIINKPKSDSLENTEKMYQDGDKVYYRRLNESNFYRIKPNGGKEKRDWLIYDSSVKAVYCYPCKLFSTEKNSLTDFGCTDWKHLNSLLKSHEESKSHLNSMVTLITRSSLIGVIDADLKEQVEREAEYWVKVLRRIVATIKLLAAQGLAFRGSNEDLTSRHKGNYLSCLVYLAKFDNFLAEHLERYANKGRGSVSYLSHQICNEFLEVMKTKLVETFILEIKEAKYFSIIVDSTPDISHQDQLTFVLRYVKGNTVVERFLGFIQLERHTAEYLTHVVLDKLEKLGLNIENCRGQTYDNAANMSGRYTGLQARIKAMSSTAIYVPCANHSLNLSVNFACECSLEATDYFSTVQSIYTFFSASPQRWSLLKERCKSSVKRLIETRWSARFDAVNALLKNYRAIKHIFFQLSNNIDEKSAVRNEAKALHNKMDSFETALLTLIWARILERVNATSKTLETVDLNVSFGVELMTSLLTFVGEIRNKFSEIELEAKTLFCEGEDISNISYTYKTDLQRAKKRKIFFDETCESETILKGKERFRIEVFNVICDNITADLSKRVACYKEVTSAFRCFFTLDEEEAKTSINILCEKYEKDIETKENLQNEIAHFLELCKNLNKNTIFEKFEVVQNVKATFPNILTLLQIYLTIPISNASGERSFSALKRIKTYLRSNLGQENLDALSLLYIENDELEALNCDSIIWQFANAKSRKKVI